MPDAVHPERLSGTELPKKRHSPSSSALLLSPQFFQHGSGILELPQEAVDILFPGTPAGGDTLASAAINDTGISPFLNRHRLDNRLDALHLFIVEADTFESLLVGEPGNHAQQLIKGPHLFELLHLGQEIFQRELGIQHAFSEFFSFFFIHSGLRLFDQREHITHTQDTGCHTFGVKWLNGIEFFTKRNIFDRATGHCPNG